MTDFKLSIVTVCYNSEKTIGSTLDSIRNIKNQEIQLIVIDGNSVDNTLEIINQNIDIVDKLISEADTGIYDAMNKGLLYASSDYVVFLNSDDFYIISNFDKYYSLLDYGYDIIYGDVMVENRLRKAEINKMCLAMTLNHPSTIIKTCLAKKIGYDNSFKISADYLHCLLAKKRSSKSIYVDSPLVQMSDGGISVLQAHVARKEDNRVRIIVYGRVKGTLLNLCKLIMRFIR